MLPAAPRPPAVAGRGAGARRRAQRGARLRPAQARHGGGPLRGVGQPEHGRRAGHRRAVGRVVHAGARGHRPLRRSTPTNATSASGGTFDARPRRDRRRRAGPQASASPASATRGSSGVDPRAQKLRQVAVAEGLWGERAELYEHVHRAFVEAVGKPDIPINDVGMMAVVLLELGFTPDEMTGLAVLSTLPGVIAHVSEELRAGRPDPRRARRAGRLRRPTPRDFAADCSTAGWDGRRGAHERADRWPSPGPARASGARSPRRSPARRPRARRRHLGGAARARPSVSPSQAVARCAPTCSTSPISAPWRRSSPPPTRTPTATGLAVFVNCAGVFDGYAGIDETSPELWRRIIDVNLTGCFHGCEARRPCWPRGAVAGSSTSGPWPAATAAPTGWPTPPRRPGSRG